MYIDRGAPRRLRLETEFLASDYPKQNHGTKILPENKEVGKSISSLNLSAIWWLPSIIFDGSMPWMFCVSHCWWCLCFVAIVAVFVVVAVVLVVPILVCLSGV